MVKKDASSYNILFLVCRQSESGDAFMGAQKSIADDVSQSMVYLCNSKAKQRKWNGFYSKYREKIKLMANWPNKAVNWKSHVFIHIVYSIQQNFLEASHLLLLLLTVFFSMQCNAMQCRWSASSSDEMNGKIHTVQSIFLFFVFSLIGICHLPWIYSHWIIQ